MIQLPSHRTGFTFLLLATCAPVFTTARAEETTTDNRTAASRPAAREAGAKDGVLPLVVDQVTDAFRVTVGGVPAPVAAVGTDKTLFYTHVWCRLPVEVVIQRKEEAGQATQAAPVLLPERYTADAKIEGQSIRFQARTAGARVVEYGAGATAVHLVVFVEEPQKLPEAGSDTVISMKQRGLPAERSDITQRLQAALDEMGKRPEGGVVYLEEGIHEVTRLNIPAKVTLYLGRGVVLHPSKDTEKGLIYLESAYDAGLAGPGVIDGEGRMNADGKPIGLLAVKNSYNIRIEGIVLRNAGGPGLYLQNSHDVDIRGVKLLSRGEPADRGTLVFDASRRCRCSETLVAGTGTGILVITTVDQRFVQSEDVALKDMTVLSAGSGIVVGGQSFSPISHVRFEDSDIVWASQGISVLEQDGGGVTDVIFHNMTMRLHTLEDDPLTGRPVLSGNVPSEEGVTVRNVVFDNIRTNQLRSSVLEGALNVWLQEFTFVNWKVKAEAAPPSGVPDDQGALFDVNRIRGLQFGNIQVEWPKPNTQWTQVVARKMVEQYDYPNEPPPITTQPATAP